MTREWIHALVWAKRHLTGEVQARELSLVAGHIRPDDTVVDVGAHAGSWSVPLSRLVPQGAVVAVEALPYDATTLVHLMRILRRKNVRVVNAAAAAADDSTVKMVWQDHEGNRLTGCTHIAEEGELSESLVETQARSLDSIVGDLPSIRFIKIDVEGAELGVLRGAAGLIASHGPLIFTELVPDMLARYGATTNDVFTLLAGSGYVANEVMRDGRLRRVSRAADYTEHDVLFVPEGTTLT